MTDDTPPMGSAAHGIAVDLLLRSIIDVMERDLPGTRAAVIERARARLEATKPWEGEREALMVGVGKAAERIAGGRMGQPPA